MSGKTLEQLIEEWEKQGIIADFGDGVSIQDTDFIILYQNRAYKNLTGDQTGDFCYKAYENSDTVCVGCPAAVAFSDGRVHVAERTLNTVNGILVVEVTASPIKDIDGNIIGAIEVIRNVISRRQPDRSSEPYHNPVDLTNLFISIEQLERESLKDDLHDGLGQIITSIAFRAYGLEQELDKRSDPMTAETRKISQLIKDAKDDISYLSLSKGPASYQNDTEDLAEALTVLSSLITSRFGIPCSAECERPFKISNMTVFIQLYRIVQESATCAARYIKPGNIKISLSRISGNVSLSIRMSSCVSPEGIDTFCHAVLKTATMRARLIHASLVFKEIKHGEILIKCSLTNGPTDGPGKLV